MSNTLDLLKQFKKSLGPSVATMGHESFSDTPRLPTGVFPFDLASGGGFPMGRVSIIWGLESSNKTNLCLKAIAEGQRMYPDKKAVFVDAEGAYDPVWAALLGVDTAKLIVLHPEYAEQAIDMIEAFLYADDVFVVILDSVAAMTTQNEIESSAEKMIVGGASLLIGKMFKKTTISFNRMRNQGKMPPAFIAVNQVRNKIGVMFGSPDTMPGGFAPKFAASFIVRVYGKNVLDKKINPVMPAFKNTTVTISKWKMPILATNAEFTMQMLSYGEKQPGFVDDWNTVSNYLRELDYFSKGEKGGWMLFGEQYKLVEDARAALYSNPAQLAEAKAQIIKELLEKGGVSPPPEIAGAASAEEEVDL